MKHRFAVDVFAQMTSKLFHNACKFWIKFCMLLHVIIIPALGVSVKSVYLVAGRLGFYSQSGHTKDFKNSIRSFRARRSAQAEVRRVLCMRHVCPLTLIVRD